MSSVYILLHSLTQTKKEKMDIPTLQELYKDADLWQVLLDFVNVRDALHGEKCALQDALSATAAQLQAKDAELQQKDMHLAQAKQEAEEAKLLVQEYKAALVQHFSAMLKQ